MTLSTSQPRTINWAGPTNFSQLLIPALEIDFGDVLEIWENRLFRRLYHNYETRPTHGPTDKTQVKSRNRVANSSRETIINFLTVVLSAVPAHRSHSKEISLLEGLNLKFSREFSSISRKTFQNIIFSDNHGSSNNGEKIQNFPLNTKAASPRRHFYAPKMIL